MKNDGRLVTELTAADMLRLLSAGASAAILLALGDGPLRTKELTERVAGYAPRTVYRYSNRLAELGLIDREEELGVPSKVVHTLSDPQGRELYDLVGTYAGLPAQRPGGGVALPDWSGLAVFADFWEAGIVDALAHEPRSLTELAHGEHGLSFHQVGRRAALLSRDGFLEEARGNSKRRHYTLTAKARRAMGLVAGIGRWRRWHVLSDGNSGLSAGEAAWLMRTALPLVALPDHGGKRFEMRIAPAAGGDGEPVWAAVQGDGTVVNCRDPLESVDCAAHGEVAAWIDSLLDGPRNGLRVEGDDRLILDCLRQLHATLRHSDNGSAATAAEAVAGRGDGA